MAVAGYGFFPWTDTFCFLLPVILFDKKLIPLCKRWQFQALCAPPYLENINDLWFGHR
jgi:hypothetical protein